MTPNSVDRLLRKAAENITVAQEARARGRADLALGNIKCARDILAAVHDAHHAAEGSFSTEPSKQDKS